MLCSYCKKPTKEKTKFSDLKPISNKEAERILKKKGAIPESVEFKKCCEDAKKISQEIDNECDEGEREIRFLKKQPTPTDIIESE